MSLRADDRVRTCRRCGAAKTEMTECQNCQSVRQPKLGESVPRHFDMLLRDVLLLHVATIRGTHPGRYCTECGNPFPCQTRKVITG